MLVEIERSFGSTVSSLTLARPVKNSDDQRQSWEGDMAKCRVCSRPRLIMHLCSKNKNNSLLLEDLTAGVNHESHQEGAGTSLRTHKTFTKRRVHFQSSEGKSLEDGPAFPESSRVHRRRIVPALLAGLPAFTHPTSDRDLQPRRHDLQPSLEAPASDWSVLSPLHEDHGTSPDLHEMSRACMVSDLPPLAKNPFMYIFVYYMHIR